MLVSIRLIIKIPTAESATSHYGHCYAASVSQESIRCHINDYEVIDVASHFLRPAAALQLSMSDQPRFEKFAVSFSLV
jgi:hypothetical protein